jgi:hypothetical protein
MYHDLTKEQKIEVAKTLKTDIETLDKYIDKEGYLDIATLEMHLAEARRKCLHSFDHHDIDRGRSSIINIIRSNIVRNGISESQVHDYCPHCGRHWINGREISASEMAAKKSANNL